MIIVKDIFVRFLSISLPLSGALNNDQLYRMFVRFLYHKLCSFILQHLLGIYMYVFKKSKIV